jgi:hypothetical protein
MGLRDWPQQRLRRVARAWIILAVAAGLLWWLNVFGARGSERGLAGVRVGVADVLGWLALILLPPLLLWAAWRAAGGRE